MLSESRTSVSQASGIGQSGNEAEAVVDSEEDEYDCFSVKLQQLFPDLRELLQEKRLGWKSEQLENLWSQRNQVLAKCLSNNPDHGKYRDFYRRAFLSLEEERAGMSVLSKATEETPRRFLDIGCAPGGLASYLIDDLNWTGIGFTLNADAGGFYMTFHHPSLQEESADLSELLAFENMDNRLQQLGHEHEQFDFVNLGVVISRCHIASSQQTQTLRATVCRNQFLLLLRWLRVGGNAMWVFSSSRLSEWLFYLNKLQQLFEQPIRLLSTGAPSRSQVYALCTDYRGFTLRAANWFDDLLHTTVLCDIHFNLWRVQNFCEVAKLTQILNDDLCSVWKRQTDELRRIRLAAEFGISDEKCLSVLPTNCVGNGTRRRSKSHKKLPSRADADNDWRANTLRQTATCKSPYTSHVTVKSRADLDSNWRNQK